MDRVHAELAAAAARADRAEAALRVAVEHWAAVDRWRVQVEHEGWLLDVQNPDDACVSRAGAWPANVSIACGRAGDVWPSEQRPPWFSELFDEDTHVTYHANIGASTQQCAALVRALRPAMVALRGLDVYGGEPPLFAMPAWAELRTREPTGGPPRISWDALRAALRAP